MGYRLAIRLDWTVWAYDSAIISAAPAEMEYGLWNSPYYFMKRHEIGTDFALFAWQNSREERLWRIA